MTDDVISLLVVLSLHFRLSLISQVGEIKHADCLYKSEGDIFLMVTYGCEGKADSICVPGTILS